MSEAVYKSGEARRIVGLGKRKPTFDRWIQQNIARPTCRGRRGSSAQWTHADLVKLKIVEHMGTCGFELVKASDIVQKLNTGLNIRKNEQEVELSGGFKLVFDVEYFRDLLNE